MNVIQQFIRSLYSPKYIAAFRFSGIGKAISYIFFLMFITSIPAGITFTSSMLTLTSQVDSALHEDLPDFELRNGILHADQEEPLYIEDNGDTIIFDATGTVSREDIDTEPAIALLREEVVVIEDGTIESFSYGQAANLHLTKDEIISLMDTVSGLLPILIPVFLLGLYLFVTAMKFIGIFSLSLFGLLLRRKVAIRLPYRNIWIMSAYAVTLPTLVLAIIDAAGIALPFSFTVYWAIAFIMLFAAYRRLPKPKKPAAS
ncbi:DUF1189 domain-containing protein [Thalassorhabdus alkalitolerans]|uniref:DUF1189 domain-containing protein n=1 Tax=Thalassorhabdus alkalitolerans TaxID=2282697 RepID=A0ABW0YTI1_9BACI|nr:DUF1189 domain-containing protein [Thalassobacillus sp. C254]